MFRYFRKKKLSSLIAALDGNWSNVVTLMKTRNNASANSVFLDSSASNQTITRYGNVTQGSRSIFNGPGSSAFFGGSGNSLTAPYINLGTSSFTIECFFQLKTLTGTQTIFSSSNGSYGIVIQVTSTGGLLAYASNNSSSWNILTGTQIASGLIANKTYHIAVSRFGGNLYIHLDGVNIKTVSVTGTIGVSNVVFGIGTHGGATLNAYLASFRVMVGQVAYNVNDFTPPTTKLPATANTVLLLQFENYGIYDATNKTNFETAVGAAVDLVNNKFGGSSLTMGSTSGAFVRSRTEETLYDIYGGNFTIECFFRLTNTTPVNGNSLFSIGASNYIQAIVRSGQVKLMAKQGTTTTTLTANLTLDNNWHHFAWVKNGSTHEIYIDGVKLTNTSGTLVAACTLTNSQLYIGSNYSQADTYVSGNVDEFRISNIVRYNGNFAVPTAEFPTA